MALTSANIDIGSLPNDGTGDPLRVAFDKINSNFEELALLAPTGPAGAIQYKDANALPAGTANFTYNDTNNTINFGAPLLPITNATVDIGSSTLRIGNLWLANESLKIGNVTATETGNTISFPVTVLPGVKASIEVNNLTATGNATINGSLNLENSIMDVVTVVTTTNTANQTVFQIPTTQFSSGKFKIISREDGTNNSQSVTLDITKSNNNSYVKMSAYGTTFEVPSASTWVTKYNADVNFGNVRVMVSPAQNISVTHTVSFTIEKA